MLEYEAVLTRREQLEATGLTVQETNAILDALAAVAEVVTFRFLWRPCLQDPPDETNRAREVAQLIPVDLKDIEFLLNTIAEETPHSRRWFDYWTIVLTNDRTIAGSNFASLTPAKRRNSCRIPAPAHGRGRDVP